MNPRAVIDTNVTVSGTITPHGVPNRVLRALQNGAFTLVSSSEMEKEVVDVLTRDTIRERFRPAPQDVRAVLTALRAAVVRPLPLDDLPVRCRDPKDDKVLACALGGNADFIVTGDIDLLDLDGHPSLGNLRIVTPRVFLTVLDERVIQ